MSHLEERLGARLLHRTTRRLGLTAAGEKALPHCRRVLAEAVAARAAVELESQAPQGHIKITAPLGLGQRFVAPALARFMEAHPRIGADLVLDDAPLDLGGSSFDVAIRAGRLTSSALTCRKLGPLRLLVCGAPSYLDAHGEPRVPADLERHRWIGYTPLGRPQALELRRGRARVKLRLAADSATNDGEALRLLLARGLGLGVLPAFWVADDLRRGTLRVVLDGWGIPLAGIYAVHPHGRRAPSKVTALLEHLARAAVEHAEEWR